MRTIILPKLEPWQLDVYKDIADANGSSRIFVVKAKRQVGKSILADILLIKYCLEHNFSTSILVEPTQAQARRCFKAICKMLKGSGVITSQNSTLITIEFTNGSEILFKSAEQDDNLRGMTVKNGLLVIDEAAYIPDEVINILYPCVDANKAPILFISTPLFKSGEFYNMYCEGLIEDSIVTTYDWVNYDTSKFLSPEKLEFYRKKVAPLRFKTDYLGEFIDEDSYVFGNINKAIYDSIEDEPITSIGIDWGAGGGGDFTAITYMNAKGYVNKIVAFNDLEPVQQIEYISRLISQEKNLKVVVVEMNSIGTVYYDMLVRKCTGINIQGFETDNRSKRRIIEQLIKAFDEGEVKIPNDAELKKQLQHYSIQKTKTGYTYNGADGVHDDYVMSLAMCYEGYKRFTTSTGIRWA